MIGLDATAGLRRIFVYGTLRPGEVRWHHLEPFVQGRGVDALVVGALFDTGHGYPAARFAGTGTHGAGIHGEDVIVGEVFDLVDPAVALAHLDDVEGAVRGLYRRVVVRALDGTDSWAYECGDDDLLVRRIDGGDWCQVSGTGSWG